MFRCIKNYNWKLLLSVCNPIIIWNPVCSWAVLQKSSSQMFLFSAPVVFSVVDCKAFRWTIFCTLCVEAGDRIVSLACGLQSKYIRLQACYYCEKSFADKYKNLLPGSINTVLFMSSKFIWNKVTDFYQMLYITSVGLAIFILHYIVL